MVHPPIVDVSVFAPPRATIVDRIAALDENAVEARERVKEWDAFRERLKRLKQVDTYFATVTIENL